MSGLETITAGVALAGVAVALGSLVVAVMEYARQGRLKRAEHFLSLRLRLKENPDFAKIASLLDHGTSADHNEIERAEQELAAIPFEVKRDYLGLFEEVALALNSGLIKPKVAHYMFGYYAILCWESGPFWINVNKFSEYWFLLANFYDEMKAEQEAFRFRKRDFRF